MTKVLVVADWSVDPYGIVAACRRRAAADEVLLCPRTRRFAHPFDLASRVRRTTGLAVHEVAARPAASVRERRGLGIFRKGGHCPTETLQVA